MAFCGIAELEPIIEIDTSKAKKAKREMVLQKLYYTPVAYYKNTKLLREDAREHGYNFSLRDVNEWLHKQAIFQCYISAPKYIPYLGFNKITVPNEVHMADLCEVPPVAEAFILIYDSQDCSLVWPKLLITDKGTEFLGSCNELMEKHGVRRQIAKSKNGLSYCNRIMRTVEEKYIPLQYAQEMLLPLSERSRVLIKILNQILIKIANTKNRITGIAPAQGINQKHVYKKSVLIHRPMGLGEAVNI
ncbi:3863_t:CDS:2 [Ambispora leptoticha]|uniref:3863_t:CDS:1 n=1 Tax=Ambispora leptoticha TaxID=144679 RepID=A0A9N9FM14_9GLOM|nr:3863_t:CDS:2 [Ambispora leptoticha]